MRRSLAAALLLLALPLPALASEPSVVLLDWTSGAFLAGAPAPVDGVNAASFPVAVDGCHRQVLVDLLYDPAETGVAQDEVGEVALLHTFRIDLRRGLAVLASTTVTQPGFGRSLGVVAPGDYEVRVALAQGAGVSWDLRVRGWAVPQEPECLPRVRIAGIEANPPGVDAGAEWIEVENLDAEPVDLSGWDVVADSGAFAVPSGTIAPALGRVVVAVPADVGLADEGAPLRLARLSVVRDEAPALADLHDDARAWRRDAEHAWTFA